MPTKCHTRFRICPIQTWCSLVFASSRWKISSFRFSQTHPTDSFLWEFLAYCAGTGGSILIIGSAAGVAAMGIEKIDFIWYMKRFSLLAIGGYLAGALVYIGQYQFFG